MRIIGGNFKGMKIKVPGGLKVRPTSSRAREALFSMIAHRISGARVLDLFAGSGALGLEALSRGAGIAVFVEKSPVAASVLQDNLRNLGVQSRFFEVVISDAFHYLKKASKMGKVFDIMFIDPPYTSRLGEEVISVLASLPLLAVDGLIIHEHRKGNEFTVPQGFRMEREKHYGDTSILLCTRREA